MVPLTPQQGTVSNYTLGATRVAAPGDVMVERTDGGQVLPGFVLDKPIVVEGLDKYYPANANPWMAKYEYHGPCPSGRYILTSIKFYRNRLGIIVGEDGSLACPGPVVQLSGAKKGRRWEVQQPVPARPFRPEHVVAAYPAGAARRQISFGGFEDNKVTLDYREYHSAGNVVPVESKRIRFDISKDKTMSYRGIDLEVIRAARDELVYRVVADGSRASAANRATSPGEGGSRAKGEEDPRPSGLR